MEIGVYNGENAKNMIESAKEVSHDSEIEYYGFDTFDENFNNNLEEVENKLSKLDSNFRLIKGDTRNTLPQKIDELPKMDLIFIDGGHSFDIVKNDWKYAKKLIKDSTNVFFHNYERKGVEKLVEKMPRKKYSVEILNPPSDCKTAQVKKL